MITKLLKVFLTIFFLIFSYINWKKRNQDNKNLIAFASDKLLSSANNFLLLLQEAKPTTLNNKNKSQDNLSLVSEGELTSSLPRNTSMSSSTNHVDDNNLEGSLPPPNEAGADSKPSSLAAPALANKLQSLTNIFKTNKEPTGDLITSTTTNASTFASFFTTKNEEVHVNIDLPYGGVVASSAAGAAMGNGTFSASNGQAPTANATDPMASVMFEHYQLPTFKDIAIVVKDKDLGSMIAYAMTTPEYERKLMEMILINSKIASQEELKVNVKSLSKIPEV